MAGSTSGGGPLTSMMCLQVAIPLLGMLDMLIWPLESHRIINTGIKLVMKNLLHLQQLIPLLVAWVKPVLWVRLMAQSIV